MSILPCLRDQCLTAFENYAQEAQRTCVLLGELEDSTLPALDRLLAILAQTEVEDQAQEAYLQLRQRLFKILGEFR